MSWKCKIKSSVKSLAQAWAQYGLNLLESHRPVLINSDLVCHFCCWQQMSLLGNRAASCRLQSISTSETDEKKGPMCKQKWPVPQKNMCDFLESCLCLFWWKVIGTIFGESILQLSTAQHVIRKEEIIKGRKRGGVYAAWVVVVISQTHGQVIKSCRTFCTVCDYWNSREKLSVCVHVCMYMTCM